MVRRFLLAVMYVNQNVERRWRYQFRAEEKLEGVRTKQPIYLTYNIWKIISISIEHQNDISDTKEEYGSTFSEDCD